MGGRPVWDDDTPYDPTLIRRAIDWMSRVGYDGCCATVVRGGEYEPCGHPAVAIHRWHAGEYGDDGDIGPEGAYDGVCKTHAVHDVVPVCEIIEAMKEERQ